MIYERRVLRDDDGAVGQKESRERGGPSVGNAVWDVRPLAGFLPFSRRFSGFNFRVTLQKVRISYGGKLCIP